VLSTKADKPFVSGRKNEYSDRPVEESAAVVQELVSDVKPDKMFIMKSRTKEMSVAFVQRQGCIHAGRWLEVREIPCAPNP
jgi:hypothetical protein